ncbi:MAG: excalibur calcium-binding domain-containing protein, partial [Rhodoferax sp.]
AERQKRLLQDKENPKASKGQAQTLPAPEPAAKEREVPGSMKRPVFQCDGRRYCQQMTSCAEAKYFLSHCPGVKMDGDGDGIPCEEQWCSR